MKFLLSFILVLIFTISFLIKDAQAYPNFIGHGYTSCLNCHYNPFGGGPLTDYGRAVGATTISARHLYPDSMTDERLANSSGLLFNKPDYSWLRGQFNYRGFQLVRNPNSSSSETKTWINMQADARLILKLGENDRFVAVANLGYTPPAKGKHQLKSSDNWRSREYYMGFRITPKIGVYAGLMDKLYGLRVIEHIAYSRLTPQVTQNDQTHSLMTHLVTDNWEGGLQYFVGNIEQEEDLRMKGVSATAERTVFGIHRLGGSFLSSKNMYSEISSYSLHGRFNLKEGSSVLAEFGQTNLTSINTDYKLVSQFGLLQTYLRPARGIYLLTNIEYLKKDVDLDPYSVRWGPGVQYFPMQRIELRFDLYNTRNFAKEASTKDSWMYLFQTHVWL